MARRGVFPIAFALTFSLVFCAPRTSAHPLLQNAIDVVIGPDRVVIDARIAAEELLIVETTDHKPPPPEQCAALATKHAAYVRDHVQLVVDGQPVNAASWTAVNPGAAELRNDPTNFGPPVAYHLEYALSRPPAIVTIRQNFLREYNNWSASCVLRERQSTEPDFDLGLLPSLSDAEFDCTWPAAPPTSHPGTAPAASTDVNVGATIREYVKHGIWHILTGYDHMLFVSALVLGAAYFWDLFKVVTAFTLAHTITLTLCVFNIVRLSEHIVEPMIAASIVIVAAQNVFFPERARGWLRLAAAFGFGLFHGLGFAGGLKDAMAGLPNIALWSALGSFSLGVEVGHQMVVIPLFLLLFTARNWRAETPRLTIANRTRQIASSAICLAGAYFFVQAIRL